MEIKQQSTGNNDSVEDAVIAIMNIKTTEGKLINFKAQVMAVYEALEARELYTHPHQWQELTNEDIARLILINEVDGTGDVGLARLVEHASRIKNHG